MREGLRRGLLTAVAVLSVACGGRLAPSASDADAGVPADPSFSASENGGRSDPSSTGKAGPTATTPPAAAPSASASASTGTPYPTTPPTGTPSTPSPTCASAAAALCEAAAACVPSSDASPDFYVFIAPVTIGLPSIDECESIFEQHCMPGAPGMTGKLTLLNDPATCQSSIGAAACSAGVLMLPSSCAYCTPAASASDENAPCAL